jgi:V8-like Glu-specific endopeptidase
MRERILLLLMSILLIGCPSKDQLESFTIKFRACETCDACSAIRIQEKTYLTAAHCFNDVTVEEVKSSGIIFMKTKDSSKYLYDIHIHPKYERKQARYDVAMFRTSFYEGSELSPVFEFNKDPLEQNEPLISVVTERVSAKMIKQHKYLHNNNELIMVDDIDPICRGNSGSPVYREIEGQLQLVGIVSGIQVAASKMKGRCNQGHHSRFIDIRFFSDWIHSVF